MVSAQASCHVHVLRVRFHIIGNACIKNVGKFQSCMASKLPIICKQTVLVGEMGHGQPPEWSAAVAMAVEKGRWGGAPG